MKSFEDSSRGKFGIILHEELLSSLVSRWGSSLDGELSVDVIHNLVLVGSVVTRDVHVLPGGLINVSSFWVGVVSKLNSFSGAKESGQCNDACQFHFFIIITYFIKINDFSII